MSDRRELSILIVLTGSLGDVVRGLPLIHGIKSTYPSSSITWLIEERWKKIIELHPELDKIIVFKRSEGVAGAWSLIKELRLHTFDIVLDLQRNLKSGIMSRFAPSPRRIGFHPKDSKEFNWIFQHEHIPYRGNSISKVDHYLVFLDQLKILKPAKLVFGFENIDASRLAGAFSLKSGLRRISVVLGSSWKTKDWTEEGYRELIKLLSVHDNLEVCLVGDRSQTALADVLVRELGDQKITNTVGKTSLIELVAIIHQSIAAVGPDSGPGHISAAVATPYVTLFGPTDPVRVAPYKMNHLAITNNVPCSPCGKKACPGFDMVCMRSISASQVYDKLLQFIS